MYEPATVLPEQQETTSDLYGSLAHLRKHYGLQLEDHRKLPYPYNILLTMQEVERAIRTVGRSRTLHILQQEEGQVSLSVCEQFRRRFDLYYIPVMPIYKLWQQPKEVRTAELLTLILAYLYVEAGISYYRDEDTYMYYNYEILEEWVTEADDEPEGRAKQLECLEAAETAGDFLQEKMMDSAFRSRFAELVEAYEPRNDADRQVGDIARSTVGLWKAYPGRHLFEHASPCIEDDEDYGYNSTIAMHEYTGFIGSRNDAVSDDLFQMVDNDFNERVHLQEPELVTNFDGPKGKYSDELAYEERVFTLIEELVTLLNQLP